MATMGLNPFQNVRNGTSNLIHSEVVIFINTVIYGAAIKGPNGISLGFLKAFLAEIVNVLIYVIVAALFFVVASRWVGRPGALSDLQQVAAYTTRLQRSIYAAARPPDSLHGIHWPFLPQNAGWPPMEATPAPVRRYYLNTPLNVRVSYGTLTIPANTEVRVIGQVGDSCRIQFGNATYTVSSSELTPAP